MVVGRRATTTSMKGEAGARAGMPMEGEEGDIMMIVTRQGDCVVDEVD